MDDMTIDELEKLELWREIVNNIESPEIIEKACEADPELTKRFLGNPWRFGSVLYGLCWNSKVSEETKIEIAQILIRYGVDLELADDSNDFSPLYTALSHGDIRLGKLLLQNGADPDSKGKKLGILRCISGDTLEERIAKMQLLLDFGADVNKIDTIVGDHQVTPLDWLGGDPEIREFLIKNGAKSASEVLGRPAAPAPPKRDCEKAIDKFFTKRFGAIHPGCIQQIVSDIIDTPVHWTIPDSSHGIFKRSNPNYTLFTKGMSQRPQHVPFTSIQYSIAEMMIDLPASWPSPEVAIKKPETAWPIIWMKRLAAYPEIEKSWLGGPMSVIANGDTPEPLGPGCPFVAWLLITDSSSETRIKLTGGKRICLYRMYPLYLEEYLLEREQGLVPLIERMVASGMGNEINVNRPNLAI